ncbi:hypothetical protein [Flavobacterium sp.]|uniref:hypothetical protein n=1 Tax=Flavobacterium sp. TaxID=239 RepID=UPI00286CB489|nr:hypothetical protein [Flavobacterium sp.]
MGLVADFKDLATSDRFIQDTREIVMNDLFYEPTENFFTIVPGIKGGQQVAAMKGFEYITKASAGCGGNGISPDFPAFSQKWNPKLAEVKLEYCYADFENSFLQWGLNNGYKRKDLTGTEMALFIQDLVSKAMALDLQRIALLSDSGIAAQDILTDEVVKAPFYNIIDKGLIPTLQYLKTLPEFASNFVALDKNTGTAAVQLALADDYAVKLYESLILESYDFDGDILLSSNRLALNYDAFLRRGNGYNIQGNLDATQNGVAGAKVAGQAVTAMKNYDRWKKTDFTTGAPATIHLPHVALFTKKEYLQIGIDDTASLQDLTLEYIGGSEEKFWIKANYMVDFKMTNPYALKAAL